MTVDDFLMAGPRSTRAPARRLAGLCTWGLFTPDVMPSGALWEKSRFTLILVTHDIDEAVALSDRIIVIRGQPGRVFQEVAVDLPRPRRRTTPEFQAIKEEVTVALDLS
jgi:hypothetical protein